MFPIMVQEAKKFEQFDTIQGIHGLFELVHQIVLCCLDLKYFMRCCFALSVQSVVFNNKIVKNF